jgi:cbb3-type cytochrome oxidase cytochrome c subunit
VSDEDFYRRAYNILLDAMRVIAVYGDRSAEDWLRDHGVDPRVMKCVDHYEYLRRLDYEVASTVLEDAQRITASIFPANQYTDAAQHLQAMRQRADEGG